MVVQGQAIGKKKYFKNKILKEEIDSKWRLPKKA
jgi:hypothetical protein